jgi:hypothetical protein
VRLTVPLATHSGSALFVAQEERRERTLELDDLLVLRAFMHFSLLDRWRAAQVLQLSEEEVAKGLAILRQRGYLVVRGRVRGASYDLKRELADRLRGRAAVDAELPLDEEAVRLRITGPPERARPAHQCRDQAFLRFSSPPGISSHQGSGSRGHGAAGGQGPLGPCRLVGEALNEPDDKCYRGKCSKCFR